MRFTGNLLGLRLDLNAYKRALDAALSEAISQAAINWLGTVTEIVPVWSGASHATMLPLASAVNFSLSIAPVTTSRIGLGLSNATGEVSRDAESGIFTFTYTTSLKHLVFNEYNNANLILNRHGQQAFHLHRPGPYHFQVAGRAAFSNYARSVKLPNPFDYVTSKPVRVG